MKKVSTHMPAFPALRAFEAVARLGSMALAAEELHVTKSAVSHQVKALEADLGTTLLKRGGAFARAEPTEIGLSLLVEVKKSLRSLEAACRATRVQAISGARRVLRLSASASFSALWLSSRLGAFLDLYPHVDLEVNLHTNQNPAWKAKDIDLAILHLKDGGPYHSALGDIQLMDEYIVPICNPALMRKSKSAGIDIFNEHRLIVEKHVSSPETSWTNWRSTLGLADAPWREPLVLNGMSAVVAAAVSGAGIALGRTPLILDDILSGRLSVLRPDLLRKSAWHYVIRQRPDRILDEIAEAFISFCQEQALQTNDVLCVLASDGTVAYDNLPKRSTQLSNGGKS